MLQYPDILDQSKAPFIKFMCYDWRTRGKRDQNAQANKTIIETIFLPVSRNGLSETITANWDVSEGMIKSSVSDFALSAVGRKVQDAVPGLTKFALFQTGQILNDYSALTFSGNNFREFSLSYDLIPSSPHESIMIKDIINTFKRNALPEYTGVRVLYPRFWRIGLVIPNGESPVVFNDSVLVDVNTEYFKDENIVVFSDGAVSASLTLSFREISRISRSDIRSNT